MSFNKKRKSDEINKELPFLIDNAICEWHGNSRHAFLTLSQLQECIIFRNTRFGQSTKRCHVEKNNISLKIEYAGSGKVLSHGFQINKKKECLKTLFEGAFNLLPSSHWYSSSATRFFINHGGKEISDLNENTKISDVFLQEGDVLVILPGMHDKKHFAYLSEFVNYIRNHDYRDPFAEMDVVDGEREINKFFSPFFGGGEITYDWHMKKWLIDNKPIKDKQKNDLMNKFFAAFYDEDVAFRRELPNLMNYGFFNGSELVYQHPHDINKFAEDSIDCHLEHTNATIWGIDCLFQFFSKENQDILHAFWEKLREDGLGGPGHFRVCWDMHKQIIKQSCKLKLEFLDELNIEEPWRKLKGYVSGKNIAIDLSEYGLRKQEITFRVPFFYAGYTAKKRYTINVDSVWSYYELTRHLVDATL